jgi:hypothetical protein
MSELPDKVIKLLALALSPSAPDGEWHAASIKAVMAMRKQSILIEHFKPVVKRTRTNDDGIKMPFGKFKGVFINELPIWYMKWLLGNCELRDTLKPLIIESLAAAEAVERAEQRR